MRITLEPTADLFRTDDGVPVRAWRGTTDRGTRVIAFITTICAPVDEDQNELLAELLEASEQEAAGPLLRRVVSGGGAV